MMLTDLELLSVTPQLLCLLLWRLVMRWTDGWTDVRGGELLEVPW